jgi:galactokinase
MRERHSLSAWLQEVYGHGHDEAELETQLVRYQEAATLFRQSFGCEPAFFCRAPGRVNLIGEHTDYNCGFVMPTAIDRDIIIAGRPRPDMLVRAHNVEAGKYEPFEFVISAQTPPAGTGHWSNYIRGAAQRLCQEYGAAVRGADLVVAGRAPHGTPIGVGLSSSTSLTVAAMLALAHSSGLALEGQRLAALASEGEWYVGTRGGIMDQFASVFGRGGHALFLDCLRLPDGTYRLERIPLPAGYRLVLCNSGVRHENTRSEFNTRVFECRVGVYMLRQQWPQLRSLRDLDSERIGLSHEELNRVLEELPDEVSGEELLRQGVAQAVTGDMPHFRVEPGRLYRVRRRCRHVVCENRRVVQSAEVLKAGNAELFGQLMDEAHRSARDDYEVSVPAVEAMVEAARSAPGCLGARITGAGWGGCVVALVEEAALPEFLAAVQERYCLYSGRVPELLVCNSATGAQVLPL